jgi:ABC-type transporter Mla subunit MlaD
MTQPLARPSRWPATAVPVCYTPTMLGDIESHMNFIIEQQAQFTTDIQILKERQAENARQIEANTDRIRQLADVSLSLARHGEETDRRIRELVESGAHTDRHMDALIDTVGRLVRRNDEK